MTLNNIVTLKSTLGAIQDHWKWHHSKACIRFTLHSNYGSILYRFGDKARYCSKSRFFHTRCIWRLVRGFPVIILSYRLIRKKTGIVVLPDGKKSLISLAVSIAYGRVMDGRTDRQRDGHLAMA